MISEKAIARCANKMFLEIRLTVQSAGQLFSYYEHFFSRKHDCPCVIPTGNVN